MKLGFLKNRSFGEVTGMKLVNSNAETLGCRRLMLFRTKNCRSTPVRTTTATPFASRSV